LRVVERIGLQPRSKCEAILVAKASLEELGHLFLAVEFGRQPTVAGVAVVDSLLSCQSSKASGGNSEPTCLGVLLRARSGPLCCLVPAPRSGQNDESENHRLDNFNHFQMGLRSLIAPRTVFSFLIT
jgi:hypothetical protein